MSSKLAIIGVILITLGATLTVTSYPNVNYWQARLFYRWPLVVNSNSSSSQYLGCYKSTSLKQIEVQIRPSYELHNFLNSTMLSTYHLMYGINPITVTLGDSYKNVSADLQTSASIGTGAWEIIEPTTHVFNIPDNWIYIDNLTVANPENYPVILLIEVTGYSLLVNNNWQTAMYIGIASVVVGAVIAIKQKETITSS